MQRISTKMKLLSLAILGLGGIALAGSAAAQSCPSTPDAWSTSSSLGGSLAISSGGLDTSACKLDAKITMNVGAANAFVQDNSPSAEPSYRAQFLVNLDALGSVNSIQSFKLFGATTSSPNAGLADLVQLTVFGNFGGSSTFLGVLTPCAGQPGSTCSTSTPLAAGVNRVEVQWVKGTAGSANGHLRVWVNNNTEGSPTLDVSADNGAWGGVDYAALGIIAPSPGFRTNHLNQIVSVDSFDSRRQTFIGF